MLARCSTIGHLINWNDRRDQRKNQLQFSVIIIAYKQSFAYSRCQLLTELQWCFQCMHMYNGKYGLEKFPMQSDIRHVLGFCQITDTSRFFLNEQGWKYYAFWNQIK